MKPREKKKPFLYALIVTAVVLNFFSFHFYRQRYRDLLAYHQEQIQVQKEMKEELARCLELVKELEER